MNIRILSATAIAVAFLSVPVSEAAFGQALPAPSTPPPSQASVMATTESFRATVRLVEGSYMPAAVTFILNSGDPTCPAGTWLRWESTVENNKAIYAALLSAHASGKAVNFYHEAGACKGVALHVTD